MKRIAIILARLDSSRLAGKALRSVLGRPLIAYALGRAMRIDSVAEVVLATTTRAIDDPLVAFGRSAGIAVFRGQTENVARRCVDCSRAYKAAFFARLNGDSPFLDPGLIDDGFKELDRAPDLDLVTNLVDRTFPYGVSVEIVSVATLERVLPTLNAEEAEHVTRRFYLSSADFRVHTIRSTKPHLKQARLVVDTEEDLRSFSLAAEQLGPRVLDAGYEEVASLYLRRT